MVDRGAGNEVLLAYGDPSATWTEAWLPFEDVSRALLPTGASVLVNIEGEPPGLLLWRSLTQWLGGMGIIVLGIAILPKLEIGGMELLGAEAPGPMQEKLTPRIAQTAKYLWGIYALLTATEVLALLGRWLIARLR